MAQEKESDVCLKKISQNKSLLLIAVNTYKNFQENKFYLFIICQVFNKYVDNHLMQISCSPFDVR